VEKNPEGVAEIRHFCYLPGNPMPQLKEMGVLL